MKKCAPPFLLTLFCAALCGLAAANATSPSSPETSAIQAAPKTPTYYEGVRAAIFAHLEKQAGAKKEIPDFPTVKTMRWMGERTVAGGKDAISRYGLLFEYLLISQKLLQEKDEKSRRLGLYIASESANLAAAYLPDDKWLEARIREGFLLPHISLASLESWEDPSRQRLLEYAVSAFGRAGERDKQISVLEWILSIAANPRKKNPLVLNRNTSDWARGTLATLLFKAPDASRADIERALSLLQLIERTPSMGGFIKLQERVQARLDQIRAEPETDPILKP